MFQESEKPHEIAQMLTFSWLFIIFLFVGYGKSEGKSD